MPAWPIPVPTDAQTVLPSAEPAALGLDPDRLERLYATIEAQIADGRYHGAQLAIARHGKLAAFRTFGQARVDPPTPATDRTLWLLFSQTKPVVGAAIWQLVDQGALSFADRIADHIPEFARHGKGLITVQQVITHQGGFPDATVSPAAWADHERLRAEVCDFALQWDPGTRMKYHGISAHWVLAALIEAVTGRDYREVIRRDLLDPLGLDDLRVGVPPELQGRCADMHAPGRRPRRRPAARRSTRPSGGQRACRAAAATRPPRRWPPSINCCRGGPAQWRPRPQPARRPTRDAQSYRRTARRGCKAWRCIAASASISGGPRAATARWARSRAAHLRPRRRGQLAVVGRPRLGAVVHLPLEYAPRRVARPADGQAQQPGPRRPGRTVALHRTLTRSVPCSWSRKVDCSRRDACAGADACAPFWPNCPGVSPLGRSRLDGRPQPAESVGRHLLGAV